MTNEQAILSRAPASTIDEVVALMTALDAALADRDGVKWFNRLYLEVTTAVRTAVAGAAFRDTPFLERLDVVFANLYFAAAARAWPSAGGAPRAWRPLFESRSRTDLVPLQWALAGMNAHINRDLPAALVDTYTTAGGAPTDRGPRYDDFTRMNDLLESVEARAKAEFATGVLARIDRVAAPADDVCAMWSVRCAREAAWTNAEVLWTLRGVPRLREEFFAQLDRTTGFAGRGLLVPAPIVAG